MKWLYICSCHYFLPKMNKIIRLRNATLTNRPFCFHIQQLFCFIDRFFALIGDGKPHGYVYAIGRLRYFEIVLCISVILARGKSSKQCN